MRCIGHVNPLDKSAARTRSRDSRQASSGRPTTVKPGSAAITPPKPYSDAVFIDASSEPATAALVPSANLAITGLNAKASTVRMPTSSAPSTAQIAVTLPVWIVIG